MNAQQEPNTAPTPVKLDADVKGRLKTIGDRQDRSIHYLMKKAIAEFVEREEQAESRRQETLSRWQEIQDGKTISNDAVMDWLDSWGTDEEKPRPRC